MIDPFSKDSESEIGISTVALRLTLRRDPKQWHRKKSKISNHTGFLARMKSKVSTRSHDWIRTKALTPILSQRQFEQFSLICAMSSVNRRLIGNLTILIPQRSASQPMFYLRQIAIRWKMMLEIIFIIACRYRSRITIPSVAAECFSEWGGSIGFLIPGGAEPTFSLAPCSKKSIL